MKFLEKIEIVKITALVWMNKYMDLGFLKKNQIFLL
jgi:hypothetical protein